MIDIDLKLIPFKVGTTSYIYPIEDNNLISNIKLLKDHFSKIQLLFFGKDYLEDVLNKNMIEQIEVIKKDSNIDFAVHLPLDLDLMNTKKSPSESINVIEEIMTKYEKIGVKEYILHFDKGTNFKYSQVECNKENIEHFEFVLEEIHKRLLGDLRNVFVENNAYDLTYFHLPLKTYNVPICFDIGHIQHYNFSFSNFLAIFQELIEEIHLHGSNSKKDHLTSSFLKESNFYDQLVPFLKNYKKSLIIEVFDEDNLQDSINFIEDLFRDNLIEGKR